MIKILHGDCLIKLKELEDNSVDSIITDPPYELGFMGKSWDNTGIANNPLMWAECLRVLKPGGHLLAFSGTRTYHRMACAIEDAGFEIRDMIEWCYGSGFPKSLNIGKVANKFLKTGNASWNGTGDSSNGALGYSKLQHKQDYRPEDYSNRHQNKDEITEEKAKQYQGWGTALKPAHEPICMARKPLAEKTVAENCLKWGTGGINIDESRVEAIRPAKERTENRSRDMDFHMTTGGNEENQSRFPANLIHDNSEEVRECFPNVEDEYTDSISSNQMTLFNNMIITNDTDYNASRFFKSIIYTAKASKSERNKGCEGLEEKQTTGGGGMNNTEDDVCGKYGSIKAPAKNNHPTVKPIALMEYLIKMVTPKGGIVLDPFMGSGSTGVASIINGFGFIGIEMEAEYIKIAEARINDIDTSQTKLEVKSGCDANDDGIPPTVKTLGILPTNL